MFDPNYRPKPVGKEDVAHNWEADIHGIEVMKCDKSADPLGYHVVFYTGESISTATAKNYIIGASHLAKRLSNLSKAGYKAPMTQKALWVLENHWGVEFDHA